MGVKKRRKNLLQSSIVERRGRGGGVLSIRP
jgi:hypothetical protein